MSSKAMSRSNSAKQRLGSSTSGDESGRAQWSQQAYSLEDIAQTFTLPLVVRCQATSVLTRRDSPLPLNLAHPVLLYSQRTVRKLLARNVLLDPRTQRYTETDETIVIPSDYPGKDTSLWVCRGRGGGKGGVCWGGGGGNLSVPVCVLGDVLFCYVRSIAVGEGGRLEKKTPNQMRISHVDDDDDDNRDDNNDDGGGGA